jgi:membrane protease YdiL (CAAX protease family)
LELSLHSLLHGPDGRVRSAWRFFFAVSVIYATTWRFAGYVASTFHPVYDLGWESIYRPLLALIELAAFVLFARSLDNANPALPALGLDPARPWFRNFYGGLLIGAAMVSFAVLLIALGGSYRASLQGGAPYSNLVAIVWVLLTGALAEELAFRSYPFLRLVEMMRSSKAAIIASSVLFAAMHLNNPGASFIGMANTVLIGILLSIAFLRTGSLWLVWGIHFGWNFALGTVFGLRVSGLDIFTFRIWGEAYGRSWLTGGAYGLEGGLSGTVALAIGLFTVNRWLPAMPPQVLHSPAQEDTDPAILGL